MVTFVMTVGGGTIKRRHYTSRVYYIIIRATRTRSRLQQSEMLLMERTPEF